MNKDKIIFIITIVLSMFISCKNESLKKLDQLNAESVIIKPSNLGHVQADFCSINSEDIKPDLKLVFAIDQSGSNKQGVYGNPGNDPVGNRRFAPLVDFVTSVVEDDPGVYLSLLTFNTQVVHSSPFVNDHRVFANQVNQIWHEDRSTNPSVPRDFGYTDFITVINAISQNIQSDIEQNCQPGFKRQIFYNTMLVSDGFPYLSSDQPQSSSAILRAIDQLVIIPEKYKNCVLKIIVHTGLYYNPSPSSALPDSDYNMAKQLMTDMATHGFGSYNEFPQSIDFGVFAVPERKVKYLLRDLFLKNMNTVWEGGQLRYDTDMDGLSDKLEIQIGSNPNQKDSDGNGVSDLVEYKVFNRPCRDDRCSPKASNVFHLNLCKEFIYTEDSIGIISYNDNDHDGLNDCEEKLLKSRSDLFSTNGSWVPDLLSLLSGMNLVGDPNEMEMDWDWDGLSNYQEIKTGMPLLIQNSKINGLQYQKYNLQLTLQDKSKECYHLDVSNIIVLSPNDLMRLYVMDGSVALDNRKIIRVVDHRLNNYELKLESLE